ncbi:MAG TPA: hypothetical protein ENK85_10725 [Saprospiraceae bacterium]|nr:hypothetical protein [Saprospiraceae bacterium]
MAQPRLTAFSKLLLTIFIVAAIFFGGQYVMNNTEIGKNIRNQAKNKVNTDQTNPNRPKNNHANSDDVVKIGVVTWGGYAGGQYFNNGFEASKDSRFYKDYGLLVEFKILDDFVPSRAAWKNDDVNLLWCTVDALPTEMGDLKDYDPVIVFQADWSRGGDAIVARRGINRVSDLKGKRIAVAEMTPSHSFLLWLLQAGGLSQSDVEIIPQASAMDAASVFKSNQVDAAVVWSPDDEACVKAVPGARILESTRSASNIIADAFIAKRSWVNSHQTELANLYEGWMIGAGEINTNPQAKEKAARILKDNFTGYTLDMTRQAINNVRLTNHGDNLNFFGLNPNYKGVTGENLYRNMTNTYTKLGFVEGRIPAWRQIAYPRIIQNAHLSGKAQEAEGAKDFTQVTEHEGKKKEAIATKRVSIAFRTGEYQLDDNAKYIIDKEFVDIAKAFSNARIRIEGNTDNTGSRATNMALSKKRAQAVADYLATAHNMPRNRFIVIGNGPDKPVASNDTSSGRAKNRRTDFELVRD